MYHTRLILAPGKTKSETLLENRTLHDKGCLTRYYIELDENRW